jgi:hypothetical protein
MQPKPLFEEKQYLGFNKYTVISRCSIALICFLFYGMNLQRNQPAELFLILGAAILVISLVLLFVLHIHTKVYSDSVVLEGFWTTRKVKLDLCSIVSVEEVPYNKFFFNNPVYNLHRKGTIRFYTRGSQALRLVDRDGLVYLIGTQHPELFRSVVQKRITPLAVA